MTAVPHYAFMALGFTFATGFFVWLCLSRSRWPLISTVVFATLTVGAFAAVVESTGQPKPLMLEWRNVADANVVGLTWNEELKRVYVWAMQGDEPVAYVLPWPADRQKMGELQDKWRRRGTTGDEFELSMDGDVAKVVAPTPMPEKTQ